MNLRALVVMIAVVLLVGSRASAKLVACIGASNTYGYGLASRATECYPAQMAKILQAFDPTGEVRNFGVNGTCVLQKGTLPYLRQGACSEALACCPDVVAIQLGGNDSVAANWVYKADFLADFLVLIDAFAQLPSRPKIYILSPPPFFPNPYGLNDNVVRSEIDPLIAQLPAYRDVQIIDTYTPLKESRHLLLADGVHFTPEGARFLAEIVGWTILGLRGTPDFNGDSKVDIQDLLVLIEHWGRAEPSLDIAPPPFGDGIIDANDLAALMAYWGREVGDPTLVAHWRLDETQGQTVADSAGHSDGTLVGNLVWQPAGGKIAGALQFGAIGACVRTPFVRDPSQGAFSVFAWIKGGNPGQVILSQASGANWLMASADGSLATELGQGGRQNKPLASATTIADGAWHRIGFAWDGSNRILYIDEIEVAKDTQTSLAASAGGLNMGAGTLLAPNSFWSGLIDEVRIYNRAVKPVSK
ncbi:MAG: GDSL-type esterase/lipase family protein [Planctomycetes bacterium]|nr:GDSL-type esterase/lipase family protein [Planctomycetota bacterium]